MGSLEVAEVSMDSAYSKLEVMIRNFTREKLNLDNQINTLQREIEVYAQALKEKDDCIKDLQIENGRYKEGHEDDEKIRLTLEAMVLSCEQKMKLLVDSLTSLQCSLEFHHDKYRDIMDFNQSIKKRQLFLKDLFSRERANNRETSSKLQKYEKWLLELQDNCNRQLMEKEALDTSWTERYKELQVSFKHLEEARSKDQMAHKDQMAKQATTSEAKLGELQKRYSDLASEKEKSDSDWKFKLSEMEMKHAETLSSMELEKKALAQSFEEAKNKDQLSHQDELAKQAQGYEAKLGDAQKLYSELASEKDKLVSDWKAKFDELEMKHSELAKQAQSYEAKLADLQQLCTNLCSEKEKLDYDWKVKFDELEMKHSELAKQAQSYEAKLADLQQLCTNLCSEKEKLDCDWKVKFGDLELKHSEAFSSLELQKDKLIQNLEEAEAKNKEQLALKEEMAKQLQSSEEKLADLQKLNSDLASEKEQLDSDWKTKVDEMELKHAEALSSLEVAKNETIKTVEEAWKKDQEELTLLVQESDAKFSSLQDKYADLALEKEKSDASWQAKLSEIEAKHNKALTALEQKHKMFHHDLVKARKRDYSSQKPEKTEKTPAPTPPTHDTNSCSVPLKKKVSFFGFSSQSSSSDDAELTAILSKKTNGTLTTTPSKRRRSTSNKDPDFVAPKEKRNKHDMDAVQEKGDGDNRNFTPFKSSSITTRKSPKKVY